MQVAQLLTFSIFPGYSCAKQIDSPGTKPNTEAVRIITEPSDSSFLGEFEKPYQEEYQKFFEKAVSVEKSRSNPKPRLKQLFRATYFDLNLGEFHV